MSYQGHPSRAAWNVNLWIANDEGLYELARDCIKRAGNKNDAAAMMLADLVELGYPKTPDGVTSRVSNIRYAMRGL